MRGVMSVPHFTALDALKLLAPPPARPRDPGNRWHWPKVEHRLARPLPDDYRRYIQAYGTGCFGRFLWPLNPFAKPDEHNLLVAAEPAFDSRGRPLDAFAAAEGLVRWGHTDDGCRLYWRPDGEPDVWPVIVWRPPGPAGPADHQMFPCNMTEFVYRWLQGDMTVRLFPDEPFKPIFEIVPYRPKPDG